MDTILRLSQISRRTSDPVQKPFALVENHWRELQKRARIPARDDIRPDAIATALPSTFIVKRVAPGVARIRVAGQKVHDLIGMDVRGMPLSSVIRPDDQATFAVHLESAFSDPAVVALPLVCAATLWKQEIHGQILLLPLADNKGDVTRVLGVIGFDSNVSLRNRPIQIAAAKPIRHEPLVRKRGPRVRITKKPDATNGRPALRLVINNV